ncbi:hypothetical protein FOL47_008118 [Perkinsus chesapeaki]|uniref:Uncharacterized protein n=1 Tax=Perkinsus chesapeaki TaxID=330153 RepID=A0A7J6LG22_PERCH|nr:hypothetical protein FOL47_008118 [Perkinsus chesapeaki]
MSDTSAFDASLMEFLETIVNYGSAISKSLADLVYTAHVETRGSRKAVESGSDSVIQLGRHLSYAELPTVVSERAAVGVDALYALGTKEPPSWWH